MENAITGDELDITEYTDPKSGFVFDSFKETDEIFSVNVMDVPSGVCEKILSSGPVSDLAIAVNQEKYTDESLIAVCKDNNIVNFYFDAANTVKCGGKICYDGKLCLNNACRCPNRMETRDGTCDCVSEYPNRCGNDCYAACPIGTEFDCGTRKCMCLEPTHERELVDNKCVCPPNKQEGADGKCHTKSCTGGTTGTQNWTCHIDDQRCGYQCSENGLNCKYGICDMGMCPNGTTHAYHAGKDVFGCKNSTDSTCMYNGSTTVHCYLLDEDTLPCCVGSLTGSCTYGICDPSLCPKDTSHYGKMTTSFGYANLSGCWRNDGLIQCSKSSSSVNCATADKKICGKGCTYDGHCTGTPNFCPKDDCQTSEDENCVECENWQYRNQTTNECVNVCPEGTEFAAVGTTNRCVRSDGVYCTLNGNSAVYCYFPNGKYCGVSCSLDASCANGTCNAFDCPSDTTLQYIVSAYAGCYNPNTGISCYPTNKNRTTWICYKNGKKCTGTCQDSYGNGCCQEEFICPLGTSKYYYSSAYSDACYNPAYGTTCLSSRQCLKNGFSCGTGCNLDGTGCTSSSKCVEIDCVYGKTLVFANNTWSCQKTNLSCIKGACTINGSKCGSGCDDEGRNCRYGICSEMDCPFGTYLSKVDTNTYGCKNPKGVACYSENGQYTCTKDGTICASGCYGFDNTAPLGCSGCSD
jgi:hypothetical protein